MNSNSLQERKVYYLDGDYSDIYLFYEGTNYNSYNFFGAHMLPDGFVRFIVYAPGAVEVEVVGDFNNWNGDDYKMRPISGSGVWAICINGVRELDKYKYRIKTMHGNYIYKSDPFAFHAEVRPFTASKVFNLEGFQWTDQDWIKKISDTSSYNRPVSIYEVNLQSWRVKADGTMFSYTELAEELVTYVKNMGYTHIEIMPISEFPYDGSWGYQVTGYYAPTSRFGDPKEFMYFVNRCHEEGIGVILDWVPAHFCRDAHGLRQFDGTSVYESPYPEWADNHQWGTTNFDYSKPQVRSFLISNLVYWLEKYHIDGIRIDAVAYILYLNFGGKDLRNRYGGHENLDAIDFLKTLNWYVREHYPQCMIIAEESTAWPYVTSKDGLGFTYKWNMGWMNDILEYMEMDPVYRSYHHKALTFTMTYAFSEYFMLPLSHDEVVHGKKSLLEKMPGLYGEKFSQLRLLFAYMYAHPGKKLTFMGGEFGQFAEWNEWQSLDWHLLEFDSHSKMQFFVKTLNWLYRSEPAFYSLDTSYDGYEWIEVDNAAESIISFERIDNKGERVICIFNFTPMTKYSHPIGVHDKGFYEVILDTNESVFGGFNDNPKKIYESNEEPFLWRNRSIRVEVPGLSALYIKYKGEMYEKR